MSRVARVNPIRPGERRVVYVERARSPAVAFRRQGLHSVASRVELLARREEFALLDEVFDQMADFEKGMASIKEVYQASVEQMRLLTEQAFRMAGQ